MFVTLAGAPALVRPALAEGPLLYVVQPGDTLYEIALRFDVTVAQLVADNALDDPTFIRVGQELAISDGRAPAAALRIDPAPPASPPAQAPEPTATTVPSVMPTSAPATATAKPAATQPAGQPKNSVRYVVQPGDHLYGIARKAGVTPQAIVDLNKLSNPDALIAGQVIYLPEGSEPSVPAQVATATAVAPTTVPATASPTSKPATATPAAAKPSATAVSTATAAPAAATATLVPAIGRQPLRTGEISSVGATATKSPPSAPAATATPTKAPTGPTATPVAARPRGVKLPGAPALNWPTQGAISQYFGENGHKGLDIERPVGAPVVAAGEGTVTVASRSGDGRGWYVRIEHGNGWATEYQHLGGFAVNLGDKVKSGQAVGTVGMTGWTTGPHLHFEVQKDSIKVDPLTYLP